MLVVFAGGVARADGLNPFNPADYPSDVQKALRYANEAAYCGTGGCIIDLLVTLPNGSVRRVFDGHVRNYEIMPTPMKRGAGRAIRFELHGGYCSGHGSPSCFKEKVIATTPFAFKMPQ